MLTPTSLDGTLRLLPDIEPELHPMSAAAFLEIWNAAINNDPRLSPVQRRVAACVGRHCSARGVGALVISSYCVAEDIKIAAWEARASMDRLEDLGWFAVADEHTQALTPSMSLSAAVRAQAAG